MHGEEDVVKDLFTWFDATRCQSFRIPQLGFDLLDIRQRRGQRQRSGLPCAVFLVVQHALPVPFRLLLRAGFPGVHEGQVVFCARADQSLTIDVVALRRVRLVPFQIPRGR